MYSDETRCDGPRSDETRRDETRCDGAEGDDVRDGDGRPGPIPSGVSGNGGRHTRRDDADPGPLVPMTCASDGRSHLVTEADLAFSMTQGTGWVPAVCGRVVLAGSMASAEGAPCPACQELVRARRDQQQASAGRRAGRSGPGGNRRRRSRGRGGAQSLTGLGQVASRMAASCIPGPRTATAQPIRFHNVPER